jgi:hypothetical protein
MVETLAVLSAVIAHRGFAGQERELLKQLFHLQAKRFETHESAQAALRTLAGAWRSHSVATTALTEHKHYGGKGRPRAQTAVQATL